MYCGHRDGQFNRWYYNEFDTNNHLLWHLKHTYGKLNVFFFIVHQNDIPLK